MVDQTIPEHRTAEGPADERCHHRLSQRRTPLSLNPMCEKFWTLPDSPLGCAMVADRYIGIAQVAPNLSLSAECGFALPAASSWRALRSRPRASPRSR